MNELKKHTSLAYWCGHIFAAVTFACAMAAIVGVTFKFLMWLF